MARGARRRHKLKNTNTNGNDKGNAGKNQKNTKADPGVGAV